MNAKNSFFISYPGLFESHPVDLHVTGLHDRTHIVEAGKLGLHRSGNFGPGCTRGDVHMGEVLVLGGGECHLCAFLGAHAHLHCLGRGASEVDILILDPGLGTGKAHEPALERILDIQEVDISAALAEEAVAVELDYRTRGADAYAPEGRSHGLYRAVLVEYHPVYAGRTVLVELGRVVVVVVEEVPLALVLDERVMIGPAGRRRLGHDDSLELIGSERVVAHGVCQGLGPVLNPGIGEVELAVPLEDEGSLLEAGGQVLVKAHGLPVELEHVVGELGSAQSHS